MEDFIAADFWSVLCEEVSGLRETLESKHEDDESPKTDPTPEPDDEASRTGAILFRQPILHTTFHLPTPISQAKLLEIYRFRVDSVYKVFHWPTVLQIFEQNQEVQHSCSSVRALQFSIVFMAYSTITKEEAIAQDLGDRTEMLNLYQAATEDSLASSQLLLGPDLITLQGFVVYLVCQSGTQTDNPISRLIRPLARFTSLFEPCNSLDIDCCCSKSRYCTQAQRRFAE